MSDDSTVLVTGGTGFIGAHTARVLVERGHEVVVADVSDDVRRLEKLGVLDDVDRRHLDLTDPTAVVRTVRETGATRVVHLGALPSFLVRQDPRAGIETNVVGTNNVFEAARTLDDQVDCVAWASSMAVYAPAAAYDHAPVDESDLVSPDSLYGATKTFGEHQARLYAERFDLPLVGLRPTAVYGPFNNPDHVDPDATPDPRSPSDRMARLFALAAGGHPVSMSFTRGAMDWVYVADVARLFADAALSADRDRTRHVYNAASGEVATVGDAVDVLRELVDVDIEVDLQEGDEYVERIDASAAREDFGFEPEYTLEAGIREYVETIRSDQSG